MTKFLTIICAMAIAAASCTTKQALTQSGLDPARFRTDSTALYTLTNDSGMEVCITNFGARIVSVMVPDRDGCLRDVVLGFDNISTYTDNPSAFGAVMGRYVNRIKDARFSLDGVEYNLPKNKGNNCMHGGPRSWQYSCFEVKSHDSGRLELALLSPDGEFGFPGEIDFRVTYSLSADNELSVSYTASTTAPTVINVTNHSFFNLSGDPSKGIDDYVLMVDADYMTPGDAEQIPTGEIVSVQGTPFDFRTPRPIVEFIDDESDGQIAIAHGYDHNLILNNPDISNVSAELYCESSGIVLDVYTDQPGVQLYSSNNVSGDLVGKGGKTLQRRSAVCLETQHFPDSPNHANFPSTELRPGKPFESTTVFAFSVR